MQVIAQPELSKSSTIVFISILLSGAEEFGNVILNDLNCLLAIRDQLLPGDTVFHPDMWKCPSNISL